MSFHLLSLDWIFQRGIYKPWLHRQTMFNAFVSLLISLLSWYIFSIYLQIWIHNFKKNPCNQNDFCLKTDSISELAYQWKALEILAVVSTQSSYIWCMYDTYIIWLQYKDYSILYAALSLAAAVASSSHILWSSYDLQCQRYQCKGLMCNRGENRSPEQLYRRTFITKRVHSALHCCVH